MARSRNIKPGFFLNDELAELHLAARLLFAGLWCVADREGRLEDKPKKIKAQVLPYDNLDIDKLLNDLHDANFIIRYTHEYEKYIQVVNFDKHQNPHKNETESTIPPYSETAPDKHSTSTVQVRYKYGTNRADSLNLIPDSFNPIYAQTEKPFDAFWKKYPKKKSKGQAEKTWQKIKPNTELVIEIMDGLEKAIASEDWKREGGQFIPYPATWLNAKGWLDEYTPYKYKPPTKARAPSTPSETPSAASILNGGEYKIYDRDAERKGDV